MSVLQFIMILLTATLVLWYLKFRWNRRHLYSMADKIPGTNGLPFLGVALNYLGKSSQGNKKINLNFNLI